MLHTRNIRRHWLRFPLMWVMLLWSLTLPGHEVMVYNYLVQGSVNEAVMRLQHVASKQEQQAGHRLKPQNVQAFTEAQTAPALELKQVLQAAPLLLLPLFSYVTSLAAPTYTSPVSGWQLLQQCLPVSVLPNAP
ncbi:hypothetical protein [Pontibacter mangrovi]|uniref:Uncharacterized protein n=1 Tax=Pontibacter mangrovi TaxID=2589816 RepID=A0A501WA70_9BACT|nr:hypothetical protein [Pontibacter mangrovi]TPE46288.1 hypothetical protein FJM65_02795 [Pontibacter mangrovi]